VYLFALSQLQNINWENAFYVFIVLHILVYPSSNGYNSYMDRDQTPIGGLKKPLQPTAQLFHFTIVMDALALLISLYISRYFMLGILLYILASRAYSYRRIRLKKYPILGYLTVFVFQGAVVFFLTYHAVHPQQVLNVPFLPCLIASLLIGALYPLTQIYQHEEDKKDGVTTISILLGKKLSFVFSMILFLSATFLLFLHFQQRGELNHFTRYLVIMLPVVLFFLYWMRKVWTDEREASFKNSLLMNVLSTICTTVFFITVITSH
jgi:1,4-dihydroxy-2-naphthoate polyprenyltransferase